MWLGDKFIDVVLPFCICSISEGCGIPWLDGLVLDIFNTFHPFQSSSLIVFSRLPFFCVAWHSPSYLFYVHLGGGDSSSYHPHHLLIVSVPRCVWDDFHLPVKGLFCPHLCPFPIFLLQAGLPEICPLQPLVRFWPLEILSARFFSLLCCCSHCASSESNFAVADSCMSSFPLCRTHFCSQSGTPLLETMMSVHCSCWCEHDCVHAFHTQSRSRDTLGHSLPFAWLSPLQNSLCNSIPEDPSLYPVLLLLVIEPLNRN